MPRQLCVGLEAVDRADLGQQLRCGDARAAGQIEQRRRDLRRSLFELLVELLDCAVQGADRRDELARKPHLQLLLAPGEPASNTVQMGSAIEPPQWHLVGRVELVQMPAQPLLGPSAPIDEIVAMIDQQLDLPVDLLALPRPAQARLAQCRTRDRERVDRARLAARPASAPARAPSAFGGTRTNWVTNAEELPLEPASQLPTVLHRP